MLAPLASLGAEDWHRYGLAATCALLATALLVLFRAYERRKDKHELATAQLEREHDRALAAERELRDRVVAAAHERETALLREVVPLIRDFNRVIERRRRPTKPPEAAGGAG